MITPGKGSTQIVMTAVKPSAEQAAGGEHDGYGNLSAL